MGSSGFLLPLEARGLYREMLTQAWRRGGRLPANPEAIRRAVGATAEEWARCWDLVKPYWREDSGDLVNDTQLEVYTKSQRLRTVRAEAGARGGRARAARAAEPALQAKPQAKPHAKSNSPDPDPDQERRARGESWRFPQLRVGAKLHQLIVEHVGADGAKVVDWDRFYADAAAHIEREGRPDRDEVGWLKARAKDAVYVARAPRLQTWQEIEAEYERQTAGMAAKRVKGLTAGSR